MLRVKNNPFDPSNRRITILVKNNDDATPPTPVHAKVVDSATGTTPPAAAPGPVATPPPPAVPAKASASPPAKPGMLSKLTGLLPGAKK
jgi:hypothetical protein